MTKPLKYGERMVRTSIWLPESLGESLKAVSSRELPMASIVVNGTRREVALLARRAAKKAFVCEGGTELPSDACDASSALPGVRSSVSVALVAAAVIATACVTDQSEPSDNVSARLILDTTGRDTASVAWGE